MRIEVVYLIRCTRLLAFAAFPFALFFFFPIIVFPRIRESINYG